MIQISDYWQENFRHENGSLFKGTLQPVEDMKIYNDDYFPIRQILRIYPKNPMVKAGDLVTDALRQTYLLGEYDLRFNYEGFRVYPCNTQLDWQRDENTLDPLTGIPRGNATPVNKGKIWVVSEVVSRESRGGDIKTREEIKRILTGSDVQLNDMLGGETVVKVQSALGITVVEVQ